ncbi:iron(III) transport system permease protein [Arthrobacter silviterrae]|uniref:Iron ABC transporter permease n=1 Tax=Arthrobacter silviterrae TaxID=2026658 RepID=A0ABX0DCT3_9MICC|nr:iron ABC transporter permease [Arthrobacter silviterrae]MDQ0278540.1 iron(III) transport system permease protein [Arthrobacter silviterrae]NGN82203.1 iron ABC transporter permease [Arthrobacter silviterrae]
MTITRTESATQRPAVRSTLPAPKYPRVFGAGRGRIVQYGVFILLALFVLAPIVPILYQSFRDRPLYEAGGLLTPGNYTRLFTDAGFGQVILNTAIFAVGTTVLTLVIAIPMAVLVVRTKLPFGRLLGLSMQWPFFISTLILGFGWITLYGPAGFISVQVRQFLGFLPWNLYSLGGMAVTEAVGLAPIAYVFCANALRQSDASLESAARVCGAGPLRILFKVVVPMLRPPIVYSSILVFSMSLETLSVPLLYGTPVRIEVFSTFLYTNGLQSIQPDYGILGAASTLILAVTIGTVAIQAKVLKNAQRFISVRGKATRPRLLDLGKFKWVAAAAIVIYIVFGALLPILGLVFRSFTMIFTPLANPFNTLTLSNYDRVFTFPVYVQSITNSVVVAAVGAVLVSILALLAVLVARRSPFKFARSVEYLALIPQAMPGIIVGIGFFWVFALMPGGGLVQGTLVAVIIAFGLRSLPTAFGSIAPAIMQIGRELDDAARTSGADWFGTFFRILRTLLKPAFVGALILVFVTMMKEYSAALFLSSANTGVIGTTMLDLWVQGNTGSVAALATIQIAITAVFVAVANMFMKGHSDA